MRDPGRGHPSEFSNGGIDCLSGGLRPIKTDKEIEALEAGQTLVTTDFVVDETLTLVRLRLGLSAAERWWERVDKSPRLRWERIDSDRFETARLLFFQYRDKDFSFTDCTSFVVMRQARLTHALTTDGQFRQAGFQVLPGSRTRSNK